MSERDTRRREQKCAARGCSLRPRRSVRTAPAHCCFAARQRSPASWRAGCLPNFRRTSSPDTRCPVWARCRSGGVGSGGGARGADPILTAALQDSFGEQYLDSVCHPISDRPERRGGMLHAAAGHRRYAAKTSDIAYGPDTRDNLLDIWRHRDIEAGDRAPVLLQIPGGAWTVNGRRPQGYPLMSRMAELGWVCVSVDYSKSPRKSWPAHIIDVKRALAWVRENIADYGGDPDFVTVTGGSAGGPFGPPVALTANDPRLQPGFED